MKGQHHAEETPGAGAPRHRLPHLSEGADIHRADAGGDDRGRGRRRVDADGNGDAVRREPAPGPLSRLRAAALGGQVGRPLSAEPFYGPLPFTNVLYRGQRNAAGEGLVTVDVKGVTRRMRCGDRPLEWAALCEATDRLATAILVDFLGFVPSRMLVEAFGLYALARLDYAGWELRPEQIRNTLRAIGRDSGITCLRCLDMREIQFDGEGNELRDELGADIVVAHAEPCPVCRWQERAPAPLTRADL